MSLRKLRSRLTRGQSRPEQSRGSDEVGIYSITELERLEQERKPQDGLLLYREPVVQFPAILKPATVCSICRDLHLTKEFLDSRFKRDIRAEPSSISFDVDVERLSESALDCNSCAVLVAAAKAYSEHLLGEETDGTIDHEAENIKYPQHRDPNVRNLYVYFPFIPEGPDGQTLSLAFNADYNNLYELYTIREQPIAPFNAIGRQAELPVDATQCIPTLKKWIDECASLHADCIREKLPLPTRVIDVAPDIDIHPDIDGGQGEQRNIRLHISHGEVKPYAALSHCWGTKRLLVTDNQNIEEHKQSIPWDNLSQTFKDAVLCTQKLGLRYLWIDSLCIKQGDLEDWAIESARMGLIYRGADIVLAATAAADGDQGLLNKRKWFIPARSIFTGKDQQGAPYQVRMRRRVSNRRQHYLWCNRDRATTSVDCKLAPLTKRAWAFQEQWLARRYVHFKQEEMIFECQGCTRCECLYVQSAKYNTSKDSLSFRQTVHKEGTSAAFQFWQQLVREFTLRQLTYASDFLPAMSGVAHEMQLAGAGEYLGGMWKDPLTKQVQLLWRVSAARAVPYRAPTWSWASINFEEICSLFWMDGGGYGNCTAKIIDAKCTPSTTDPTGAVSDGYLIISGPLLKVVNLVELPQKGAGRYRPFICKNQLQTYSSNITDDLYCFQTDFKLDSHENLFFLLVRVSYKDTPEGLVLQRKSTGEPYDIYERVGVFLSAVEISTMETDIATERVDMKGKVKVFSDVPHTTVKVL